MFKLTRPCVNCPFRRGVGDRFGLNAARLREIVSAPAFQCHKTVDYSDDCEGQSGDKPQQCAGLMSLLHRQGIPNAIMQVGERMGHFDPSQLDHSEAYEDMESMFAAHAGAA